MTLADENYMDMARRAFQECSSPAEMEYVANSISRMLADPKSRQSLTELLFLAASGRRTVLSA